MEEFSSRTTLPLAKVELATIGPRVITPKVGNKKILLLI